MQIYKKPVFEVCKLNVEGNFMEEGQSDFEVIWENGNKDVIADFEDDGSLPTSHSLWDE